MHSEDAFKVSIACRRWLKELSNAADKGADAVARCLASVRIESDRIHRDLPPPAPAAGDGAKKRGLAQQIDAEHHAGLPPLATYVARTAFIHTLAFNEQLKGLTAEELRYSMLGPATDISFIEEARKRFIAESEYLDDRPGAPMRTVLEGIEAMEREEAAYWLGMAIHRPNPRRVLCALRTLLTVPQAMGRRS